MGHKFLWLYLEECIWRKLKSGMNSIPSTLYLWFADPTPGCSAGERMHTWLVTLLKISEEIVLLYSLCTGRGLTQGVPTLLQKKHKISPRSKYFRSNIIDMRNILTPTSAVAKNFN